jgi:hypothetical protein
MDKLTGTNDFFNAEMISSHGVEEKLDADKNDSTKHPSAMTYQQLQSRDEALISQILGHKELDLEMNARVEAITTDTLRLKEDSYFPDELPWQLRSPILTWGRKILGKITGKASINILRLTDIAYGDKNNPVTGHLDYPHQNICIDGSTLPVVGWVLGIGGVQPCSVIVAVNKKVCAEVPIDQLRPGVSEAYCIENSDHKWGFYAVLSTKELPDRGVILAQARFSDEQIVPISAISFYR